MSRARSATERVARRFGGPRVLALPLLRLLAVVAGLVWVVPRLSELPRRAGA